MREYIRVVFVGYLCGGLGISQFIPLHNNLHVSLVEFACSYVHIVIVDVLSGKGTRFSIDLFNHIDWPDLLNICFARFWHSLYSCSGISWVWISFDNSGTH